MRKAGKEAGVLRGVSQAAVGRTIPSGPMVRVDTRHRFPQGPSRERRSMTTPASSQSNERSRLRNRRTFEKIRRRETSLRRMFARRMPRRMKIGSREKPWNPLPPPRTSRPVHSSRRSSRSPSFGNEKSAFPTESMEEESEG